MKSLIGSFTDVNSIKRFYFKGEIKVNCPNCKTEMVKDFDDTYLSYPEIGTEGEANFYCEECEKEWSMPIVLKSINVVLDYDDEKISEIK